MLTQTSDTPRHSADGAARDPAPQASDTCEGDAGCPDAFEPIGCGCTPVDASGASLVLVAALVLGPGLAWRARRRRRP